MGVTKTETETEHVRLTDDYDDDEVLALPTVENPSPVKTKGLHPAFFIAVWIALSSGLILFNKQILGYGHFPFPIILTTWHLTFASVMTQILARFTTLLDSRKKVPMTTRVYIRAILPIGVFFSLSLICGNVTYLYLSVPFIQMLKSTTPVVILFCTWAFKLEPYNFRQLVIVSVIVFGVMISCFGEVDFNMIGVLYQIGGIVFEAIRLVMVQRLLSSAEYKLDPLVSLYYFAPVCALMNGAVAAAVEVPRLKVDDIFNAGVWTLVSNAMVAFLLNISVVFLISRTSSLVMRLSGVFKDILIVVSSLILWQTPMSAMQTIGYTIALTGLVFYMLGYDRVVGFFSGQGDTFKKSWENKRQRMMLIVVFFFLGFTTVLLITGLLTAKFAPEKIQNLKSWVYYTTAADDTA